MSKVLAQEERYYWDRWLQKRDSEAADVLMKFYEPLVQYHVRRLRVGLPSTVSTDDLTSYGYMGLYDALRKFDASRELKFDTYASFRIRGAILDGLRKDDPMPRTLREKSKKIEAVIEDLEQKNGRRVTLDEVAIEMNMDIDDIHTTITDAFLGNLMSIDEEIQESGNRERIVNLIEDKQTPLPEDSVVKDEFIDQLSEKITELNEKEQLVISLFYYEELTLTEIGRTLQLSTSRISQIHSKALLKLKKVFEKDAVHK